VQNKPQGEYQVPQPPPFRPKQTTSAISSSPTPSPVARSVSNKVRKGEKPGQFPS
jgi:hypothetical protein